MEITARYAEYIAEKIGGQIGHETGSEIGKENADAHAEGPNHGDRTVRTDVAPATEPVDAQPADQGECGGTEQGGEAEESAHSHTAQRGVRHPSAGNDQAARYDVTAHAGAE